MPPYIDGKTEPPQLFYSDGDGNYVPFTGIQEAVLRLEQKYDPDVIVPAFTETGELCWNLTLTAKSTRRWRKTFHTFKNRLMRERRTAKRQKEKQRRLMLKEGI